MHIIIPTCMYCHVLSSNLRRTSSCQTSSYFLCGLVEQEHALQSSERLRHKEEKLEKQRKQSNNLYKHYYCICLKISSLSFSTKRRLIVSYICIILISTNLSCHFSDCQGVASIDLTSLITVMGR